MENRTANSHDSSRKATNTSTTAARIRKNELRLPYEYEEVAQLSQRDRATHELLRLAKLWSGIFEPPFGGVRGKVER